MDLGVDLEKEPQFARSRKKPLEFLRESVKTLRKVGKQYEKPGLLFIVIAVRWISCHTFKIKWLL